MSITVKHRHPIRAAIETLESRQLLSASLNATNGVLTVTGTNAADSLEVERVGNHIVVSDKGVIKVFDAAKVKYLVLNGLGGADQLDVSLAGVPSTLNGGEGDDTIYGSNANDIINGNNGRDTLLGLGGKDLIYGHAGDDILFGGVGDDRLRGGEGNDLLTGDGGSDHLFGDAGNDWVSYNEHKVATQLTIDNLSNDGAAGEGDNIHTDVENIIGGEGDDAIQGSSANNILQGGNGNDYILGMGGDDKLEGDAGNDTLIGGLGKDAHFGGADHDYIEASDGTFYEIVNGGEGNDTATYDRIGTGVFNTSDLITGIERRVIPAAPATPSQGLTIAERPRPVSHLADFPFITLVVEIPPL